MSVTDDVNPPSRVRSGSHARVLVLFLICAKSQKKRQYECRDVVFVDDVVFFRGTLEH